MTAALEAAGLGRRFGRSWALRDCNIQLPMGGVVALVGPNGAGKSTLLNLFMGMLDPTEGALAKRPAVLLLDEPLASLDPLARRDFMEVLMATVADGEITVVLSSHIIGDLERVCDSLLVLTDGRVALAGRTDELLADHFRLVGEPADTAGISRTHEVIEERAGERQTTMLVRGRRPIDGPKWDVSGVGLEDLVLAYLGRPASGAWSRPRVVGS